MKQKTFCTRKEVATACANPSTRQSYKPKKPFAFREQICFHYKVLTCTPVMTQKAIMQLFTDRTVPVHSKPWGQAGLGHTEDITRASINSRWSQAPGKPRRSSSLLPTPAGKAPRRISEAGEEERPGGKPTSGSQEKRRKEKKKEKKTMEEELCRGSSMSRDFSAASGLLGCLLGLPGTMDHQIRTTALSPFGEQTTTQNRGWQYQITNSPSSCSLTAVHRHGKKHQSYCNRWIFKIITICFQCKRSVFSWSWVL